MAILHSIFDIFKFLSGLGALAALLGIGLMLLWFAARIPVTYVLRHQPAARAPLLRKLFLEP